MINIKKEKGTLMVIGIVLSILVLVKVGDYYEAYKKSQAVEMIVVHNAQDYSHEHLQKNDTLTERYYVSNHTDFTLRYYKTFYSDSLDKPDETLMLIPPHSTVAIDSIPDYILREAPSVAAVWVKNGETAEMAWRTVLEIQKAPSVTFPF